MLPSRFRFSRAASGAVASLLAAALVSACGGGGGSSAGAPANFRVVEGDGQATVSWTAEGGVQYWLFYAPSVSFASVKEWSKLTGAVSKVGYGNDKGIGSPYIATGLTNGTPYYFAVNGRNDGGDGGPLTAVLSVTPRPSGNAWKTGGSFAGAPTLRGVTLGTDSSDNSARYLAVGDGGIVFRSTDAYPSTDPLTWEAKATLGGQLNAVIYTLGKYIAVGTAGKAWYATTADSWSAGSASDARTDGLNALASNGGTVVAVGDNGRILTSTDGQSWSPVGSIPAGTPNLYGVAYSPSGLWVAVGAGCKILTSTDATTWTTVAASLPGCVDLRGISVSGSSPYTLAAVGTGATGGALVTSSDGTTWTQQADLGSTPLYAVAGSYDGRFTAVGGGGAIFFADSLTSWAPPATNTAPAQTMYSVTRGNATYTSVGVGGSSGYAY